MNYKLAILALASTGFLIGCSDSQNPTPQEKNLENTVTKAAPSLQQEPKPALTSKPEPAKAPIKPSETASPSPEILEKDVQTIADTFIEKGSKTPRHELEQKIKKSLEAATSESPTTVGFTRPSE